MDNKETIEGVILVTSCHKHLNDRMKEFTLEDENVPGWKVLIFIGNPYLTTEYVTYKNLVILKCEDSYYHLLKKVSLAIKYIDEHYIVKQGIVRCGDDCHFNMSTFVPFLENKKEDYMGIVVSKLNQGKIPEDFMVKYYDINMNQFDNPMNKIENIKDKYKSLNVVPYYTYIGGSCMYLSMNAALIILDTFKNDNYDTFLYSEIHGYKYIIEDIAIGFILYFNQIKATYYDISIICESTNKYK